MTAANPTISVARVSVLLATLAVFLSLWLTIAVHPWNSPVRRPRGDPCKPRRPADCHGHAERPADGHGHAHRPADRTAAGHDHEDLLMQRYCFQAMGTTVDCLLEADTSAESSAALWAVEAEFRRLEALLSRFLPDSELSALNRDGSLYCGPDLVRVTLLALEARAATGGRFDPTMHDALVAAGYDRSFAEIDRESDAVVVSGGRCGGRVAVDPQSGLIELEHGVHLDLGGIAKGDAVDRTCDLLGAVGPCLVNAGGDLAVRGRPASGSWPIGLETSSDALTLALTDGALATSGRDRRRWKRAGVELHHLIDPSTGLPSTSDLVHVTAIGSTAVEAEIRAKSLFLAGTEAAIAEADALGIPAVLVTEDGRSILAGGLV